MSLTAAQRRVPVVLSAPLRTERGGRAVPATYVQPFGNDSVFLGDSITLASDLLTAPAARAPRRGGG